MGSDTSNTANDNNPDAVPVILHVYKPPPDKASPVGMVYHSGVEVYGSEYYYGAGGGTGTGIAVQTPKKTPTGSDWVFYQSITMSKNINKTRQEVREIVVELRTQWKAMEYHLSSNNCNHFSDAFVRELCGSNVSIPSWVNRLARMGNMVLSSGLISNDNKTKLNDQMSGKNNPQLNAQIVAEYGSNKKMKPQPVIEYVPDAKTIFLLPHININECGALNLSDDQDTSFAMKLLFTQDLNNNSVAIKSENDEQLLLFIPFKKKVKLEAIGFGFPFDNTCPKIIKLFSNKKNLDFDDAETLLPTHKINIKSIPNRKNDNNNIFWAKSYPLKVTKFRNINFITVFIEANFDDDISKLFKIEFWGQD